MRFIFVYVTFPSAEGLLRDPFNIFQFLCYHIHTVVTLDFLLKNLILKDLHYIVTFALCSPIRHPPPYHHAIHNYDVRHIFACMCM